jgi:hypothetical protein
MVALVKGPAINGMAGGTMNGSPSPSLSSPASEPGCHRPDHEHRHVADPVHHPKERQHGGKQLHGCLGGIQSALVYRFLMCLSRAFSVRSRADQFFRVGWAELASPTRKLHRFRPLTIRDPFSTISLAMRWSSCSQSRPRLVSRSFMRRKDTHSPAAQHDQSARCRTRIPNISWGVIDKP